MQNPALIGFAQVAQRQHFIGATPGQQCGHLVRRPQLRGVLAAGGQVQRKGLQLVAVFHGIGALDQILCVIGIDQRIHHRTQHREGGIFDLVGRGRVQCGRAGQEGSSQGETEQTLHADLP